MRARPNRIPHKVHPCAPCHTSFRSAVNDVKTQARRLFKPAASDHGSEAPEQQPRHQNSSQEHHNSGQEQESSRQERKTSNQQHQTSSQVSTRGNLSNDTNPAAIFAPATRRQEHEASSQEHRAMTVFLRIIGPVYETAFRALFWGGGDIRSPIVCSCAVLFCLRLFCSAFGQEHS